MEIDNYTIMEVSELIGSISATFVAGFAVYINHVMNRKFDKLDDKIDDSNKENKERHESLEGKVDEILPYYTAERKIHRIAKEIEPLCEPDDKPLILFIQACVEVSIYFYEQLTAKDNYRLITEDEVSRCSNLAIEKVSEVSNRFEEEFKNEIWDDFIQKAKNVQVEFLKIFNDTFNMKEKRFVGAIETYLFDQLQSVVTARIKFNAEQKANEETKK